MKTALALLIALAIVPLDLARAETTPPAASGPALQAMLLGIGGIFAGADFDVHFSLTEPGKTAPDGGPLPVAEGMLTASITMPAMPGMPPMLPVVHGESFPGCYGVITLFPHGGRYHIEVTQTAPNGSVHSGAFDVDVADAPENGVVPPPAFTASLQTAPAVARAGTPVDIRLTVHRQGSAAPWTDLLVVHEKPWHLMVMSRDLRWFHHIHPLPQPDGSYRVTETFPAGGEYLLLSDVSPRGAGQQFLPAPLHVVGAPFPAVYHLAVTPTLKMVDGVKVRLDSSSPLRAHSDTTLAFALTTSNGRAVTGLQPYLGAMGHLIIVSEDRTRFVHSHPVGTAAPDGIVRFLARFPKPGLYKAWAQFQRNGQVITADFVVEAKP